MSTSSAGHSGTAPASARISPPKMAAWRAFLEAHARVTDVLARELRDEESLPLAWYDVLVQLQEAPDHRLRMQELAEAVLLSKSGLTRLVDRMERQGLVRRSACADDRRGILAELTDEGYATLRRTAGTHLRGVDEHFASLLSDDEAAALADLLGRMSSHEGAADAHRGR
jgi:DNA-binding MarR family transcriptional regulator